ncbi:MAG: type III-A CRISPR-associated protein Cas10/Csm1 [Thermodesulfobacteriota bacterium]
MNLNENEFHAVVLGALLHDIGKFVQRAQKEPKKQDHSHWGEEWFQNNLAEKLSPIFNEKEKEIIRSAIFNHHYHVDYVSLADAISAGMDRTTSIDLEKEEKGDPFTDRLISIFSKIWIKSEPRGFKYNRLASLGSENLKEVFPVDKKKCSTEEYFQLLKRFNEEIRFLNFDHVTTENLVNFFFFLLWKYCWCIPSAAYEDEPDVPLFDHLKTTAALAACFYIYHKENPQRNLNFKEKSLCLISGDISGIQPYIFEVLTQQGKVAKRLRARSLFVQLISEISVHKILHSFQLPLCNLILSAGGNFWILAPNLSKSATIVDDFQKEFDEWCLKKLNGELSVSLSSKIVSGQELLDIPKILEEIKVDLNLKKMKPFSVAVQEKGLWQVEKFVRPEVVEGDEKACPGCHKFPIKERISEEEAYCQRCFNDIKVGGLLPKVKYMAFYKNSLHAYEIFGYSFELWGEKDQQFETRDRPYLTLSLSSSEFKSPIIGFKYIANHIPTKLEIPEAKVEGDQPVTLEDVAEKSNGDKLLGYVKGDVDNMGIILKEGFKKTKFSISRFSAFSRLLETFFAGYLQEKIKRDFKETYTVFSGGDDFFLIAPWDKAIDLARDIRKDFSEFCADNSDLTFSTGIFLAKSHEPIFYCAEIVDTNLKKSKGKEGKNKITLFSQTVSWDELGRILEEAEKLIKWLNNEPPIITRAFAHNLRKYGEMAYQSAIYEPSGKVKTEFLRFIPLLVYDAKRNLTKDFQKSAFNWTEELVPSINNPKGGENLEFLKTIMDYVLTYTRSSK